MEMDTLESILRIVLYIASAIGIVVLVGRFIWMEWKGWKNSRAEVETCAAVAYFKDPNPEYLPGVMYSSGIYYITFHTDAGDIVKVSMGPRDFYAIEEGSRGILTWQGQKFWKFESDAQKQTEL